jgi:hypothetical protein
MKRWLILMILVGCGYAQNTPTIGVLPDNGPVIPLTCVIGQLYFKTSATTGLSQCTATNTWTVVPTSGGGTVTNTGGSLTSNAVVLGAGGNDTKVSTGITTNGASELDLGVSGTSGVLGLNGSTSGKATITAPAIAGTTTNGIVSSNVIVAPIQTGPSYSVSGQTAQGFGDDATIWGPGAPTVWVGANQRGMVVFNGLTIPTAGSYGFATSNINGSAGVDTKISRSGAGLISSDTTTQSNGLGAFTNCRIVVNVTPVTVSANVTTDQSLMAFTLPANCLNTVGRTLRIFVAGVYSTAAASTAQMTLKVKICSVSGCGSGNVASVISIQTTALGSITVSNNAWNGTFYVATQTGGATGAWEPHGAFNIDLGAITAADSLFNDTNTATVAGSPSAIDTTAQNFLQITFAFSAASTSNSVTERQLVIDSVN